MKCPEITIEPLQKIFRGMLYDPKTKKIYASCMTYLGIVRNGKIYWKK